MNPWIHTASRGDTRWMVTTDYIPTWHRQCPSATGIYMIGALDYIDFIQIERGTGEGSEESELSSHSETTDWATRVTGCSQSGGTWRQLIGWWQKMIPVSFTPALRSSVPPNSLSKREKSPTIHNVPIVLEKKSVTINSKPGIQSSWLSIFLCIAFLHLPGCAPHNGLIFSFIYLCQNQHILW